MKKALLPSFPQKRLSKLTSPAKSKPSLNASMCGESKKAKCLVIDLPLARFAER